MASMNWQTLLCLMLLMQHRLQIPIPSQCDSAKAGHGLTAVIYIDDIKNVYVLRQGMMIASLSPDKD